MASFAERTRELEDLVGDGPLIGRVGFSPGKIAGPQHLGGWITGPLAGVRIRNWTTPGTGPDYLGASLLEHHPRYLEEIARATLETGPRPAMERSMGELREEAKRRIPRETGRLAESGNATVEG